MSKNSDLGKYIRDTIKIISQEEAPLNFNENRLRTNNLVFADIDRLSILTNGDLSDDDNYFDPLKSLTEGMM